MSTEKQYFIDNKVLYEHLSIWINNRAAAIKKNEPVPPVPEYIGECILVMANRLAQRGNFYGYTYKEDMVGDAIESCLRYLHNFNPTKSTNAFAYITQIIYNAFVRRIQKERRVTFTKAKLIKEHAIAGFDLHEYDTGGDRHVNTHVQFLQDTVDDVIEKYETAKTKKKERQKARKQAITDLFVEEV